MKLCDRVWALSAFNCNSFGPSVLFDLLLREVKHVDKLKSDVVDCITSNTCSSREAHFKHSYATLPVP